MLTKHYTDAIGFDIVFFLPDSEDDFASYTEFLRYLGAKNRAGVAKFVDGTTLFLVPPSDFLTKVLKVAGPERLYGVVLKFSAGSSGTPMPPSLQLPITSAQYIDRPQVPPSEADYGLIPLKEEQVLPLDYNRMLHEDSKLPPKPLYPASSGPPLVQSVTPDYTSSNAAAATQPGVSLTPELIATLATLLPGTSQSSAADGAKSAVGSSTMKPPFPSVPHTDGNQSHLWKQDHQFADPSNHNLQHAGSTYYQPYPLSSSHGHPGQGVPGNTNVHDSTASLQQQGAIASRPINNNFMIPSQSGQLAVVPQVNHQYQGEVSSSSQRGYGVVQGTDASGLYSSQAFQQPSIPISSSNQIHGGNPSQHQTSLPPYSADKVNTELQNQQQFQSALLGASQGTPEVEADKNQRYQSTLQFAANLLLQIQQQQQTQGGLGPGNQQ